MKKSLVEGMKESLEKLKANPALVREIVTGRCPVCQGAWIGIDVESGNCSCRHCGHRWVVDEKPAPE